MAEYTTKEFAKLSNESESTIRKHIERNKLQRNQRGYIDTEDTINKIYINTIANGLGITPRFVKIEENKVELININLYPPEDVKHLK